MRILSQRMWEDRQFFKMSLEELCTFSFQILKAPFQGGFANSSGVIQNGAGRHTPPPLRASVFPSVMLGILDQINGFHLVPIKSSEEAPRFKMGNGRSVISEVWWWP